MAKRVLLKDIAEELGVSIALVSYVLNNKRTDKINPETARKIQETARKKRYVPNQIAKSLKVSKTHMLGLIVADISNLFSSYIARYIEDEANRLGYNVLYGSAYESPERFNQILNVMLSRQVDGLILAVPENAETCIADLKKMRIPFVVIDRVFPQFKDYQSVSLDNFQASAKVVSHFVDNGARRLGAIGLKTRLFHLRERKQGFLKTAKKQLSSDQVFMYEVAESAMEANIGKLVEKALKEDRLDALCFFTNKIAMAALPHILKHKVKVPEDLQIVCFDEARAYRLFPYPLVYVKQPLEEMSKQAVQCLIGDSAESGQSMYKFDGTLIHI
ncbi:LacI family DNA-binding transcriptional regulator [Niabella terrae]